MNNNPSLNEINKTANMDPNLITRHYRLKLMNDFMNIKYLNPKLKQSDISIEHVGFYYTETKKRYKYAFTIQN